MPRSTRSRRRRPSSPAACRSAPRSMRSPQSEPAPGRGRLTRLPGRRRRRRRHLQQQPRGARLGARDARARARLRDAASSSWATCWSWDHDRSAFHQKAGELAARSKVALLVGVGPLARHAVEAARRAGIEAHLAADDAAQAAQTVPGLMRPGDLVVIKGSRGVRLELVVEALIARRGEAA